MLLTMAQTCSAAWKAGDALPDLNSFKIEGKLPDKLKGQVIVLDFWASWCGPCKRSFPAMQELYDQFAKQGVVIIAVSVDVRRADMQRFLKSMHVSFATIRDADQKMVAAADVSAMPTSFVIDRAGRIRFVHAGFSGDQTVKQYREQIKLLLKESAP
ncbi:MAG TPA: TlpA disulfide reductase family protein [Tepidisphaeraceae bacterium]|nr:TlpA disulfide reductase family protein [Tepidisphaeraceae bacterium]